MVYKCFDKKSSGNGINLCQINNLQMDSTNQLLDKFKRSKVYSSFKGNPGVLILQICNLQANTTKELDLHYA